jgi:hypothetical protein
LLQSIPPGLFHGFAHIRRDIEGWVAGLQPQHFSALGLLFQQAVAPLDYCAERYLVNNIGQLPFYLQV